MNAGTKQPVTATATRNSKKEKTMKATRKPARRNVRKFDDQRVLKILKKDNPRREATIGRKLYDVMKRCRTVGDYRERGRKVYPLAMAYLVYALDRKEVALV